MMPDYFFKTTVRSALQCSRGRHCCAEIWPLKYRFCPHCGEILMTNASALAKK